MTRSVLNTHLFDRGGRRRIKDRRFRVSVLQTPERRTGLRRRSGWDRRCLHKPFVKGLDQGRRLSDCFDYK